MDIYRAQWVVPVTAPPVREGAIAVRDGRIAYVGPHRDAPRGTLHDLGNALLLPGLVNTHTHLELTAMRGFLEELPFAEWIGRLQRAKTTVLTPQSMLDSAKFGIAEGLLAGITTYADTCDSGVALEAMRAMGVRGIMYQEVFGPDPASCADALATLRQKLAVHRPAETALVRVGVSPHAPYTVSDVLFEAVTALAAEMNLAMAVHIAESADEEAFVRAGAGPFAEGLRSRGIHVAARNETPVGMLHRLGVLGQRPLLIHCVRTDADDTSAIAAARCPIAHCPTSNAKLGHGAAPLAEWLERGITVGLGSDSMASNNRMHILEEARVALLVHGSRLRHEGAVSPARLLELATMGGARCLALDSEIGSLETGKAADFAVFSLDEIAAVPHGDPVATAIFSLGGARAVMVAVAGELRVTEGRLVDRDDSLIARVRATGEALRASTVSPRPAKG